MRALEKICQGNDLPNTRRERFFKCLKNPGICLLKSDVPSVCTTVKQLLQSECNRAGGLFMLDAVLDKISDNDLTDCVVYFMRALIEHSKHAYITDMCYTLLHRFILRLGGLPYVQREIGQEVFPQLMQAITRALFGEKPSCALLRLIKVTVAHFGKMCAPNRAPMEKSLLEHIARCELLSEEESELAANTFSTLALMVSDPEIRHDTQTGYLEMMTRSVLITEQRVALHSGRDTSQDLNGTIYAGVKGTEMPFVSEGDRGRWELWRRIVVQLRCVKHLISSPVAKTIDVDGILDMVDRLILPSSDEAYSFLRGSTIQAALDIVRELMRFDRKMIIKNRRLTNFLTKALELTLDEDTDLSHLRTSVYNVMAEWIQAYPPVSFYSHREATLLQILKITMSDVRAETAAPALVVAALRLQKSIVMSYGEMDREVSRHILKQIIPPTLELCRPFRGNFRMHAECRMRVYELLLTFCICANTSLMPPTPEIDERIAEGIHDAVFEVREMCRTFHKITLGIISPLECGFKKSASHALHESHRAATRIEIGGYSRTRNVETQTTRTSAYEKTTSTEDMSKRRREIDEDIEVRDGRPVAKKRGLPDRSPFERAPKAYRGNADSVNGNELDEEFDEEDEADEEDEEEVDEEEDEDGDENEGEDRAEWQHGEDSSPRKYAALDEGDAVGSEASGRTMEAERCAIIEDDDDDCIVFDGPHKVKTPERNGVLKPPAIKIDDEVEESSPKKPIGNGKSNGNHPVDEKRDDDVVELVELKPVEEDMEEVSAAVVAVGSDDEDCNEKPEEPCSDLVIGEIMSIAPKEPNESSMSEK